MGDWGYVVSISGLSLFFIGIQLQIHDVKVTKLESPSEGLAFMNLKFKGAYLTDQDGKDLPNKIRILASAKSPFGEKE